MMKRKSVLREYSEAILIALVFAIFIRTFIVQAFRIPSGSMETTLLVGDQILVDKIVYKFREPQRGEIIVFKYPEDPSRDFIKRVIGLPGETIELRNRVVYINGKPLQDNGYARHDGDDYFPRRPRDNFGPVVVPQGKLFMMGDNRENSMDSRWWGFLSESEVLGRAFIIYWSRDVSRVLPAGIRWNRFGLLLH